MEGIDFQPVGRRATQRSGAAAKASLNGLLTPSTMPDPDDVPDSPVIPEMRAVVLNSFGGLKSMKLMSKPKPQVEQDHVIVKVKAW